MATVGSLLVVLRADTSPFARSFKGAEDIAGKFTNSLLGKIVGAAAITRTLDAAIDALADSLDDMRATGSSAFDALIKGGEAFAQSLQQIPVAGGLGRIVGRFLDPLFGSPLATEALRERAKKGEFQQDPGAGQKFLELFRATTSIVQGTSTAYEKFREKIRILDEARRKQIITEQQYLETVRRLKAELPVYQAQEERIARARQSAAQVYESTRTPLERYREQIANLNQLLRIGYLDWDTYGRAVDQAMEALRSAVGYKKELSSNLLGLGAGNGFGDIGIRDANAFSGRNVIDRSQDQVASNTKKQLDLTAKQLEELKKINQTIKQGGVTDITIEEINL